MKLDYLKEKRELLPGVLLAVSAFLAVLVLIKVTAFFVASARAENIVKRAVEQSSTDDKSTEEYFAESTKLADELKKNNLFAPPPPKQHPVKEVWGIFGDQVLIKDKWYDVGDKVGDAKIVAIGPTSVKMEWDGKEKTFKPIDAAEPKAPSKPGKTVAKAGGAGGERADMVVIQSDARPMPGREGGRGPGPRGGFDGMRERFMMMRQGLENISEQEREKLRAIKERWPSMSEKEREGVKAALRKRFGGERPPQTKKLEQKR
jgi:hypothetical protein